MSVKFTPGKEFQGVLHLWDAAKQADDPKQVSLQARESVLIPHLAFLSTDGVDIRIFGTDTDSTAHIDAPVIEVLGRYSGKLISSSREGHGRFTNHELDYLRVRIKTQDGKLFGTLAWNGDYL